MPPVRESVLQRWVARAAAVGLVAAFGWSWARRTRAVQSLHVALVVASVALTAQLAAWHLIGWGMS